MKGTPVAKKKKTTGNGVHPSIVKVPAASQEQLRTMLDRANEHRQAYETLVQTIAMALEVPAGYRMTMDQDTGELVFVDHTPG